MRTDAENDAAFAKVGEYAGAATEGWNARWIIGLVDNGFGIAQETPADRWWKPMPEAKPGDQTAGWSMPMYVIELTHPDDVKSIRRRSLVGGAS